MVHPRKIFYIHMQYGVKGEMSLRHGMWYGLRIMPNVLYAEQLKEINSLALFFSKFNFQG